MIFTADNPLHRDYGRRTMPLVPGINAQPMHTTGQKTVRDCRLTDKHAPSIRVKAPIAVTGGHVTGAQGDKNVSYGRIPKAKRASLAQRKAARRERIVTELRKRGYDV